MFLSVVCIIGCPVVAKPSNCAIYYCVSLICSNALTCGVSSVVLCLAGLLVVDTGGELQAQVREARELPSPTTSCASGNAAGPKSSVNFQGPSLIFCFTIDPSLLWLISAELKNLAPSPCTLPLQVHRSRASERSSHTLLLSATPLNCFHLYVLKWTNIF